MRFAVDQPIAAARDRVEAVYLDAELYRSLGALGAIRPAELLEKRCDADRPGVFHLRVAYAFVGDLSPVVRAVLDPERLTWVDESTFDTLAHEVCFRMVPDHFADRLRFEGTYRFVEAGPAMTRQLFDADLRVSYPLVGGLVERAIVTGLRQYLAKEAELVAGLAGR